MRRNEWQSVLVLVGFHAGGDQAVLEDLCLVLRLFSKTFLTPEAR